jgi:hypothetical protein
MFAAEVIWSLFVAFLVNRTSYDTMSYFLKEHIKMKQVLLQ